MTGFEISNPSYSEKLTVGFKSIKTAKSSADKRRISAAGMISIIINDVQIFFLIDIGKILSKFQSNCIITRLIVFVNYRFKNK